MATRSLDLAAIVLAAGAGSRFSARPGDKLLAILDGKPLLEHVLGAIRDFGPEVVVVVLGRGAARIEEAIEWHGERRVVNPAPEQGLASSLRAGMAALMALPESFDGAFIALGDQPRLRAETMHALEHSAARARPADRPLVVPSYEAGDGSPGPRNPVLLLRPIWPIVDDLEGDQGLASLIETRPDLVMRVPVAGSMPDVDTQADLERLAAGHDRLAAEPKWQATDPEPLSDRDG